MAQTMKNLLETPSPETMNSLLIHSILEQAALIASGSLCCIESTEHSRDEINAHINMLVANDHIEEIFPQDELGFPRFYRVTGITEDGRKLLIGG